MPNLHRTPFLKLMAVPGGTAHRPLETTMTALTASPTDSSCTQGKEGTKATRDEAVVGVDYCMWSPAISEYHREVEAVTFPTKPTPVSPEVAKIYLRADGAFADLKLSDPRIRRRAEFIRNHLDPKAMYSREHREKFCGHPSKASAKIFSRLFVRLPKVTSMRHGEGHEYIVHPRVYRELIALTNTNTSHTGIS